MGNEVDRKRSIIREVLTVLSLCVALLLASLLLILNVKWDYATLIRIESEDQHNYIVNGKVPNIDFVSLRDTPYAEEVKILKVKYCPTIDHLFNSEYTIDEWLGAIGIRSYPELLR